MIDIPLWDIIPTCDDAMSCYTLIALCIFAVIGSGIGTIAYWWTAHEFKRIDDCIKKYDDYIDETGEVIHTLGTDIAVLRESMQNIEKDGSETKDAIKEINKTLMNKLVRP